MVGGKAFVFTKKIENEDPSRENEALLSEAIGVDFTGCDPTPLFWSTLEGSMPFAPLQLQSKDQAYQEIQGLAINPPLLHFIGPEEGLEKATTLARGCANVYLSLHNKSTKNLILKNITQVLKQSGLTSNSVGSNSGNMQAFEDCYTKL